MSDFDKELNFECWLRERKKTYGNKARTRRIKLLNPYIRLKYSKEIGMMRKYSKNLRKWHSDRVKAFSSNDWYKNDEID
jgi:hypothetical protein